MKILVLYHLCSKNFVTSAPWKLKDCGSSLYVRMFERVHETKRLGRKGQAFFSLIRAIESMRLYRLPLMTASA
jgi:hypothetical protein